MSTAILTVRVSAFDEALPVPNAQIIVSNMDGSNITTVYSDENGLSPGIELQTPPREAQFDPNLPVRPYSKYIVEVIADGYVTERVVGVQMFADMPSELPINMPRAEQPGEIEEIDIPENTLLDPDAHRYETAPPPSLGRLHREVFIPTSIRVKLGAPTSAARIVTVSFIDYLKNVASSEIFPDWPYHSLRANIHCQISVAINRVFTEWYPSRGHNFDITNTTQFDQKFIDGRNIFASVGAIVDEIFNTYINRPPGVEPLFATYCDGHRVTCSGLSQWGTVTLANQGRDFLSILRFYFGVNTNVITTTNIRSNFESFSGTLSQGAAGANVQMLQRMLNRIRRNFPLIPQAAEDGVYGAQTAAAVRTFQQVFSLPQTGVVNRATWYRISQIFTAVTRLAELGSEGLPPPPGGNIPLPPPVPCGNPAYPGTLLRNGSRGENVRTMQRMLNNLGAQPRLAEDGIFGPLTENAVRTFQRKFELNADGIIGPITWARVVMECNNLTSAPPPTGETFDYTVTAGDTLWLLSQRFGTTVDVLRSLNGLVSDVLSIGQVLQIPGSTPAPPEGTFDYTVVAGDTLWLLSQRFGTTVDALRSLNGLINDVLNIGQVLRIPSANRVIAVQAIEADNAVVPDDMPESLLGADGLIFPGETLRADMQSDAIRQMQQYLNDIGRVYAQIPQIKVEGHAGPLMQLAVLSFQRLFGLTASGNIDVATWKEIVGRRGALYD